jgi:hypothetical protein
VERFLAAVSQELKVDIATPSTMASTGLVQEWVHLDLYQVIVLIMFFNDFDE